MMHHAPTIDRTQVMGIFMEYPVVIKIGGHEIDDPATLLELSSVVKHLQSPVIIVHGGGKEISALQTRLGITPQYVDGLRITDTATLSLVEMVLCGAVNKRVVRYLLAGGIDAMGLSGVDRGLIRAVKLIHKTEDMGFTGDVAGVRGDILLELLEKGVTPVIAPICLGDDNSYNVNADHVAGAVAKAVEAARVVFLTNVQGVMKEGQLLPSLTSRQAEALIKDGTISGGMIPKVETALAALKAGVPRTAITSLVGLKTHGGTIFSSD
jgi:acetylglutamate kinase